MKELILSSTIVTGKIYCSKLTNNILFVCEKVLKQSKKEFFARVKSAMDHRCDSLQWETEREKKRERKFWFT